MSLGTKLIIGGSIALFIFVLVYAEPHRRTEKAEPARQFQMGVALDRLEADLRGLAEGRWEEVGVEASSGDVTTWVIVDRHCEPNHIALTNYCRIMRQRVERWIPHVDWAGEIHHRGSLIHRCP